MHPFNTNVFFICVATLCSISLFAQSDAERFITDTKNYFDRLNTDATYKDATQLAAIKAQLPGAQEALSKELSEQKQHKQTLIKSLKTKTYTASVNFFSPETNTAKSSIQEIGEARINLQERLRNSKDLMPLKTAIARAQWILTPLNLTLKNKALKAAEDEQKEHEGLTQAEEDLDASWNELQSKNTSTNETTAK